MSRRRSSLRLAAAAVAAAAISTGALGACSKGGGSFPDRDAVVAAQAAWCDGLARVTGGGAPWKHLEACKAAYPTASAEYLKLMGSCFTRRLEAAGDDATDQSQMIAECNEEVTVAMKEDEAAAKDLIEARCARMTQCEKVPAAECKAAFGKLETAQKIQLTTIFNAAGRYEIADCLQGASCTDDEEAGRDACYKPVSDNLLWFPE